MVFVENVQLGQCPVKAAIGNTKMKGVAMF